MSSITCTPKSLPKAKLHAAAAHAFSQNPSNRLPIEKLLRLVPNFTPTPDAIAVMRGKYWGKRGVRLSVSFLDGASLVLRRRIVEHMNAWQRYADVRFSLADRDGDVRIARLDDAAQGGYWSYVGTDILSIDADQPTLNLEGFTMDTPEAEFRRVVRHEAGHTLGFVHEHMRAELVARIDREKAFKYFKLTQGWSREEVEAQVLTPIQNGSLLGNPDPDPDSVMCYQLPAEICRPAHRRSSAAPTSPARTTCGPASCPPRRVRPRRSTCWASPGPGTAAEETTIVGVPTTVARGVGGSR